jgi:cyclic-di-GMP-binding protein
VPSFDTVSELDGHEVTNAIDQANRELEQRFDFRGAGASYEREAKDGFSILMKAQSDFQLKQMLDILRLRLSKRGIDVNCMDVKDIDTNLGGTRQTVLLKHGIDKDNGREVVKRLKESGLKVQAQIQGDKVRVTGKKRDDLQAAMALLRAAEFGVPLQFQNFRDD